MSTAAIIRAKDCRPVPWKNGLGVTREIAVHPPGADMEHFVWRASVAEVNNNAPFSPFAGIDRSIVLIEGAGFRMTLDGGQIHALDEPFTPFLFAGEAKVAVTLSSGPTRDFNLMVRRNQARGEVHVWRGLQRRAITPDLVLIYCAVGSIEVGAQALQAGDAWRTPTRGREQVHLHDGAIALAIHIIEF